MTLRPANLLLAALVLLAACNRAPQTNQAIRDGIIDHLNKNSGLDVKSIDVTVTKVKFESDRAEATVEFRPKASPDAGMAMNYTLERKGPKWVVQKAAAGGHGGAGGAMAPPSATQPPAGDLPAGHPPVGGGSGGQLPAGHPPVASQAPQPPKK